MHDMTKQYMIWKSIDTAPDDGKPILVGFKGQFKWSYYVADAYGSKTGDHMQYAKPTHWTEIIAPED